MMQDLISRQDAIDHFRLIIDATNTDSRYNMGFVDGLEFCISHLSTMPSAQPEEAIALTWINKHLEWLDNCDNEFAQLARVSIRAMVEIWKKR